MQIECKKILLVNGHSIYENNSTSITLKSIMTYFGKDDVLELYYYPINNYCDENCEIKSIKLNRKTKKIYSLVMSIYKKKIKGKVNNVIANSEIQNKTSILKNAKKFILAINDYLPINMECNNDKIAIIDKFKPDIIYTLGSEILPLEVSLFFSNRYNIPIVLHHMDNWRETKYTNSYLFKLCRNRLSEKLNKIESSMDLGMTISDEMADYYNTISNTKYVSLMNTVPKLNIKYKNNSQGRGINVVYAGGMHLDRWKTLLEFEYVIKKINNEASKESGLITLIIFTKSTDKEKYGKIFDEMVTKFYDFLPHNEVFKIYELSDILIHVESFDTELIKFTKYSLSTKIPEYMSAGRPIICYAPKEIAASKYIKKNNCGISVSNAKELETALKLLIGNFVLRKEMGDNGIKAASEKHSEEYKTKIMKEVFTINR